MLANPTGDRPAAFDITGDVWQRQGPPGSASWWCAARQADDPIHGYGRTWVELDASVLGPMTPIVTPQLARPAYTGAIPAIRGLGGLDALVDAVTDPIPASA